MIDGDVDGALRGAGDAWREGLDADPSIEPFLDEMHQQEAGPALRRSRRAKAFAVLAAACIVALVVALTTWLATRQSPRPGPVVESPELRAAERVSDHADRLYEIIEGSGPQQAAADYLPYRRVNDKIAACMTRARVPYQPPLFINQWEHYQPDAGTGTTMLARLDDPVATRTARALVHAQHRTDRQESRAEAHGPGGARYRTALRTCQRHRGSLAPQYPALHESLLADFDGLLYRVDGELKSDRPAYGRCMAERGYHIDAFFELFDYVISPHIPHRDVPAWGQPGDAAWQAAVAYEKRALAADATCRVRYYEHGMRMLGPLLNHFAKTHAADLHAIQRQWQVILRKANNYPGSPGF